MELSLVTQGRSVIKSMCCVDIHILGVISWKTKGTVYLLFTRENRKFRLENQMVRIISFIRKLQKIWAVIWEDAINLFFYPFQSVQLILDLLCSGSFTHHFKFNRFIFLHKISTQGGLCKWFTSRVQQCSPESMSSSPKTNIDFISNFILLMTTTWEISAIWLVWSIFSLIWNTL